LYIGPIDIIAVELFINLGIFLLDDAADRFFF
jgi:hypothetical protein